MLFLKASNLKSPPSPQQNLSKSSENCNGGILKNSEELLAIFSPLFAIANVYQCTQSHGEQHAISSRECIFLIKIFSTIPLPIISAEGRGCPPPLRLWTVNILLPRWKLCHQGFRVLFCAFWIFYINRTVFFGLFLGIFVKLLASHRPSSLRAFVEDFLFNRKRRVKFFLPLPCTKSILLHKYFHPHSGDSLTVFPTVFWRILGEGVQRFSEMSSTISLGESDVFYRMLFLTGPPKESFIIQLFFFRHHSHSSRLHTKCIGLPQGLLCSRGFMALHGQMSRTGSFKLSNRVCTPVEVDAHQIFSPSGLWIFAAALERK